MKLRALVFLIAYKIHGWAGDGQVPLPLKLGFLTVRLHTLPLKLHPCCCRLAIGAVVIAFLSLVTLLTCVIYDVADYNCKPSFGCSWRKGELHPIG